MVDVTNVRPTYFNLQDNMDLNKSINEKMDNLRINELKKAEELIESDKLASSLVERLLNDESIEILQLFDNKKENKFVGVYDCAVYATIHSYLATCNLFPEEIARAVEVVNECADFCNERRKKWTFSSAMAQVLRFKPNYDTYTDGEAQAELSYAGIMVMKGILNFIRDNNVFTMIAGTYHLKTAHQSFKLCCKLMRHRTWENKSFEETFVQGTLFGLGSYNVILSLIPKRILRILEFIGFTGDQEKGIQMLAEGASDGKHLSVGSMLCFAFAAMYYLELRYFLGKGSTEEELKLVKPILDNYAMRYPNSAAVLYLKGRTEVICGNFDRGLEYLQLSMEKETKRTLVQLFPMWNIVSLRMSRGETRIASKLIQRMRLEVNVSKCIFAYAEAVFLLASDNLTENERKYALELLELTPDLMAQYCGKHIPYEKWCAKKSRQFFAQDNFLLLPEYEFMYAFNTFFLLKMYPDILHYINERVDKHLVNLETRKDWNFYTDNYCVGKFLKGLCLNYLGKPAEAYDCFVEVINRENDIYSETYLIICSHLEAGIVASDMGKLEDAIKHLRLAKKRKLFWVEFRIHQARDEVEKKVKAINGDQVN